MSAEARHHAHVLARDCGCMVGRLLEDRENCEGSLQAAHVPPKSATKAFRKRQVWRLDHDEDLPDDLRALAEMDEDDLVADGDLGLAICRGHHRPWDLRGDRLPRSLLPVHVERRCAELGMTRLLDELLGPLPGDPDLRPPALRRAKPTSNTPERPTPMSRDQEQRENANQAASRERIEHQRERDRFSAENEQLSKERDIANIGCDRAQDCAEAAEATATQLRAGLEGHVEWLRRRAKRAEGDPGDPSPTVHASRMATIRAYRAAANHAEQVLKDG